MENNPRKTSDSVFAIGLIIMIIGWLGCLNPFLILLSAPIFILGLVIVLLSKKSAKTKLLAVILPFPFWIIAYLAIIFFLNWQSDK